MGKKVTHCNPGEAGLTGNGITGMFFSELSSEQKTEYPKTKKNDCIKRKTLCTL
jgi:hypothetical protein